MTGTPPPIEFDPVHKIHGFAIGWTQEDPPRLAIAGDPLTAGKILAFLVGPNDLTNPAWRIQPVSLIAAGYNGRPGPGVAVDYVPAVAYAFRRTLDALIAVRSKTPRHKQLTLTGFGTGSR